MAIMVRGAREIGKNTFFEKRMLVFFRDFEILHTIFWMEANVTNGTSQMCDENVNVRSLF